MASGDQPGRHFHSLERAPGYENVGNGFATRGSRRLEINAAAHGFQDCQQAAPRGVNAHVSNQETRRGCEQPGNQKESSG